MARYQFSKEEISNLLYDYNIESGVLPSNRPKKVHIWDETLRDGEQTPGVYLTKEEKIIIACALDDIGVSKMAVGFPAVSNNELESVKSIQQIGLNTTVLAIARPVQKDIDACLSCDLDEIVLFMPISDLLMNILKTNPEKEIETITTAIEYATEHGLKFNWVSEDATRAQPEHMLNVFQTAVDLGTKSIVVGDTVGVLQPITTTYLINKIKNEVNFDMDKIALGIHTHNDFGQAVSNTLNAVYNGATLPHVCVNGYGERAGNASFEEVVVNLEGMGIDTGIELSKLTKLSELVEKHFALPISAHKPIVGDNAFSHESGLHINGILAHPISYEPINPKIVGQTRKFYLGKFSGTNSILNALNTKLKLNNLQIPYEVLYKIVEEVKSTQEMTPKEEITKLFNQTKEFNQLIRNGLSDSKFFEIVMKHAHKYLKGTWADPSKPKI